jgi:hypothetical protein
MMSESKISFKVTGFGCQHNFKDAEGKVHKFAQKYQYVLMKCPRCSNKVVMLYPALNKCSCGCMVAFCSLNDGENRIGTWDVDELKKNVE